MGLESYIRESFPEGLQYNEAAQLCFRLYCSVEGIPEEMHEECSKDGLAEVFANLSATGFLTDDPLFTAVYGANFHKVEEKGHWVEVIASIFRKGNTRHMEIGDAVVRRLTISSIRRP